ncbi:MAG: RNA pyrophosphohydrolase [Rhodospirillaceae bacterium]|nr:RNA pyrophosphohydrolase [Rhodospirillaceae bacterium]
MTKPYRRGVGIVLVNSHGRVFVAQRIDTKEPAWQMPQGGMDTDETPRAAALRELLEEIGTDKARIIGVTRNWLRYELPAELQRKMWGGKYLGQEQKWFLMRFTGRDGDIDLDTAHPEFRTWKWLPFAQLPRVIVGFKRELYRQIVTAFREKVAALASPRIKPRRSSRTGRAIAPRRSGIHLAK